jgi:hypothetical protein
MISVALSTSGVCYSTLNIENLDKYLLAGNAILA